jgi:hypothetical protein
MSTTYRIIPTAAHNELVRRAYPHRSFNAAEANDAARFCEMASTHSIRTHNAIKALHLDHLLQNIQAVLNDILGHGNEHCMLPGQPEANNAEHTAKAGGLLFTEAEIEALNEIASECGMSQFETASLSSYEVSV